MFPISKATLVSSLVFLPLLGLRLPQESALATLDPAITQAALQHHVRALANMEDRTIGGAGASAAAAYVTQHFERLGLKTVKQGLSLLKTSYNAPPELVFTLESGETYSGKCGIDFELFARGFATTTKNLPIRAVSLLKKHLPDPDPNSALFIEGSPQRRRKVMKANGLSHLGAFGLDLEATIDAKHARPGRSLVTPRSKTFSKTQLAAAEGSERVVLRSELLRRFITDAPISVQLKVDSNLEEITAFNVIGYLPGSDHSSGEALVITSRYDAPGAGVGNDKRRQRSLAIDEATGVAALLEVAEALAAGPKPARTVIFVATCGLEVGRLGIDGYLDDPIIGLDKTVALINLDRMGRPEPALGDAKECLYMTGTRRSDLHQLLSEAGVAVVEDPYPRAKLYARLGDLENGARGVISHSLSSYPFEDAGGVILGVDGMDYANLEMGTHSALAVVHALCHGGLTPGWREGMQPKGIVGLTQRQGR